MTSQVFGILSQKMHPQQTLIFYANYFKTRRGPSDPDLPPEELEKLDRKRAEADNKFFISMKMRLLFA